MSEQVQIGLLPPQSIAGIGAYRDQSGLHEVLRREFWLSAPEGAGFVEVGPTRLGRLGPSRYVVSGDRGAGLPGRLAGLLDGVAAVTDQSDLWAYFGVAGEGVQEVLSRVVPVNLHPASFPVGALALTRAGHVDARVFRTGILRFEIAVARSYAEDLRHLFKLANHG
jgi:heterotetrameric sarcosine oxidase gamma subunit